MTTKKNKEFALRPGNHDIELRDHDGRTVWAPVGAPSAGIAVEAFVKENQIVPIGIGLKFGGLTIHRTFPILASQKDL